ncbi:MAG: SpoIIE family protein phosphatase [Myxococcales bacterium]|nr:SpoIIE family protein phosphatase [Myxococcales bacterium]
MKFRSAILASSIALVAGVVVSAVVVVGTAIDASARRDVDEELARSVDVFVELQGYRLSLFRAQADVVAQEPRLKAVVNTEDIDHATVLDSARELQRSAGSDLLLLTDGRGLLRADTADPKAEGFDLSGMPVIADALRDGSGSAIWVDEAHAYQVLARRLSYADEAIGVVVLGFAIDDRVAETVARQTGAQVVISLEGRSLAASSLDDLPGGAATVLAAIGASPGDATQRLDLDHSVHVARSGVFPGARDDQALRFTVLRSLDKALADSRAIVQRLLLIAGLGIAIAVILAIALARRLARPLDRLVDQTRAIAGGDLKPREVVRGPEELAALAGAMNQMVSELAESREQLRAKQRLEDEMEIAARIQTSILPSALEIPGIEVAALMRPATEVGGDYYDLVRADDGAWIGVGDVAGHGLKAGLVMLMIQSAVASLVRERPGAPPRELVSTINAIVCDNVRERLRQDEHVTFTLFRYHRDGRLVFAGAHEPFLVLRRGATTVEEIPTPGTWIGVLDDIDDALVDTELRLEPGDLVVLYTDGLIEGRDADGAQFGIDRVCEIILARRSAPTSEIADALADAAEAWRDEVDDDISVVVFRVR